MLIAAIYQWFVEVKPASVIPTGAIIYKFNLLDIDY